MQNKRTIKETALQELKTEIASDLIVDYVIDHLIDTNVFTEEEKTQILYCGANVGRVDDLKIRDQVLTIQSEYFIDLLLKKTKTKDFAFNSFIFILMKESYYPWIAHKLLNRVSQINKEARMLAHLNATPSFFVDASDSRRSSEERNTELNQMVTDAAVLYSLQILNLKECRI